MIYRRLHCVLGLCLLATSPLSAVAESFYANAVYLFNVTSDASTTDIDFDESNGQAFYLGYKFLPALSVEFGGVYFEPVESEQRFSHDTPASVHTIQETEYDVYGYTAGLRAETDFAGLYEIWGALGVYSWESTFNYEIRYPKFPGLVRRGGSGGSGEDLYYRVGVRLPIVKGISATAEAAHFELTDFFSNVESGENTDFEQRYIGVGLEFEF